MPRHPNLTSRRLMLLARSGNMEIRCNRHRRWLPERKRGQYKLFAAEIAHPCIPEEYTNFVLWLVFISLLLSSISRTEPCHANTTYSQNYACSHAIHLPGLRNKRATAIRRFREYHTQCGLFIHAMAVPSLASHELRILTR